MKNLGLIIFWLFILVIFADLGQLITKYFTLFYFNLFRMGITVLLLVGLGLSLKINRFFLALFALISLALIVLGYVIVWN